MLLDRALMSGADEALVVVRCPLSRAWRKEARLDIAHKYAEHFKGVWPRYLRRIIELTRS